MKFTKEDDKLLKSRGVKKEVIEKQLDNFEKGFDFVKLSEPAGLGNGIKVISEDEEKSLIDLYDNASKKADIVKMVPASGSATRMFQDLYKFMENYDGSYDNFLKLLQNKDYNSMSGFFEHLNEFPFYSHLEDVIWKNGKDLRKLLTKRYYFEILDYLLTKKGLNYGDKPKALVDFHIYRDFVRTALDEHLVEASMYATHGKEAYLHFTVSKKYLPLFKERVEKVASVFEKVFKVKYKVSYSIQKPSTDTVSIYKDNGETVRDEKGNILFRPGGHGALIHNLNDLKADVIFIKNIDNVAPDRNKPDTVKYKKLLAGVLLETQSKVFEYLDLLDKKNISDSELNDIKDFIESHAGIKLAENLKFNSNKDRISYYRGILNRPIRVCGMVKNEGEPGGGPFWVEKKDGSRRLMIIESAQVNKDDSEQKKIFEKAMFFNPVDIVCATKDRKGRYFDLADFIDEEQGFITTKSYKGKDISVQELPGLWNGAMANWITVFVEVPLSTFTPVKTVFDLRRSDHKNVLIHGQ
ncbi:MAG: DUF4301 family protein [Culturomica sp.]|nr:DUF4301 family protein [Culturomica sp.]